jgi:hypothetical protein
MLVLMAEVEITIGEGMNGWRVDEMDWSDTQMYGSSISHCIYVHKWPHGLLDFEVFVTLCSGD